MNAQHKSSFYKYVGGPKGQKQVCTANFSFGGGAWPLCHLPRSDPAFLWW